MVTPNNAPHNNIQHIQIDEALELLRQPQRIAFIDVRDRRAYVDEHPIFSVNAPIDSIELHINQLFGGEAGIAVDEWEDVALQGDGALGCVEEQGRERDGRCRQHLL